MRVCVPVLRARPGAKGELCTCPLARAGSRGPLPRPSILSASPLEILERRGQTRELLPKAHFPKSALEDQHRASPLLGPFSAAVPPKGHDRYMEQFGRRRWTLYPGLGLWPVQPVGPHLSVSVLHSCSLVGLLL